MLFTWQGFHLSQMASPSRMVFRPLNGLFCPKWGLESFVIMQVCAYTESDTDPGKRTGSDRIRIRNTGTSTQWPNCIGQRKACHDWHEEYNHCPQWSGRGIYINPWSLLCYRNNRPLCMLYVSITSYYHSWAPQPWKHCRNIVFCCLFSSIGNRRKIGI